MILRHTPTRLSRKDTDIQSNISALFGGKKLTYDTQFYEWINEGRNKDRIYGFPYTLGAWCNSRLKVNVLQSIARENNLRKTVLSHTQETEEASNGRGGEERDGWQRHGAGCGANSQLKIAAMRTINSRIPNPKRDLVQQQPQNCCHTGFQSQSAEGIGVPSSNSGFSDSPIAQGAKKNIVQYLGIAADEPERIKRHSVPGKVLPLVDIGWDEAYCRQWCEENDLLSPIYTTATRGGCWFCHNQGVDQLRLLRKDYPDLWQLLLKWDKDSPTTFKADGHTVHDYEKRFEAEDKGIVKAGDRRFRWKQVLANDEL